MTTTTKLTKTQSALLDVLRLIRDDAAAKQAYRNAKAIGGMTEKEAWEVRSVHAGYRTYFAPGSVRVRADKVTVRTFWALRRAGLVECRFGMWGAV